MALFENTWLAVLGALNRKHSRLREQLLEEMRELIEENEELRWGLETSTQQSIKLLGIAHKLRRENVLLRDYASEELLAAVEDYLKDANG